MHATRQARVVALIDTVGTALILQLAFVAFALPIVTTAPAAVALQRQLADLQRGERAGFAPFAREFARSWRASWPLGIAAAAVTAGFAAGIPFWYAATFPFARVGLGLLVCLLGLAGALYLNVLSAAEVMRAARWRRWLDAGFDHLARNPLRSLSALIVLGAWLVALAYAPTLVLVGSGLVPALIARYLLAPPANRQASRS